jgi:hypothetical protein
MDKIINYLLLIIIFVFDPLAISLVIAANFAFNQIKPKKEEDDLKDWREVDIDTMWSDLDKEETSTKEEVVEKVDPKNQELNNLLDKIGNNIILDKIEEKISNNKRNIGELDRATGQMIDTIKGIDDYLKHHAQYYSSPGTNWDIVKKETIEEEDIIKPKLRSKPKSEIDSDTKIY